MKKFISGSFAFLGLLLIFTGCSTMNNGVAAKSAGIRYGKKAAAAPRFNARAGNRAREMMSAGVANNMADSAPFARQEGREIAYTANFDIEVADRQGFVRQLRRLVETEKGFITAIHGSVYDLKVPAARANAFLEKIRGFGKVSGFNMDSSDLTDELADQKLRLDNLMKLRDRLTQLLKKAQKVEDIIKIEEKLSRVTRDIELCQSQIKRGREQVDYTSFTINVLEKTPVAAGGEFTVRQFDFLQDLLNPEACPGDGKIDDWPLPEGFVRVNDSTACSADNCLYRVWSVKIPEGKPEFWYALVKRQLSGSFYGVPQGAKQIKCGKTAAGEYFQLAPPAFGAVLAVVKPGCWLLDGQLVIFEFLGNPDKPAVRLEFSRKFFNQVKIK